MVSLQNPVTSTRHVAAAAKSLQSCPTLCDPIDSSPPGSLVPGIHQARTLDNRGGAVKEQGLNKSFTLSPFSSFAPHKALLSHFTHRPCNSRSPRDPPWPLTVYMPGQATFLHNYHPGVSLPCLVHEDNITGCHLNAGHHLKIPGGLPWRASH